MRYLLDTHAWLWLATRPERMRPALVDELRNRSTKLVFSAACSWEIALKWSSGRLPLPQPPAVFVPDAINRFGATGLPVEHAHALHVSALPLHHADPFDRLLIAQAQLESLPIVTADPAFDAYEVEVIKATN